jgi:hypothetical protein
MGVVSLPSHHSLTVILTFDKSKVLVLGAVLLACSKSYFEPVKGIRIVVESLKDSGMEKWASE